MKLVFLFLITFQFSYGQRPKECEVYQWEGIDSTKRTLALKINYNNIGQIIYEKYNDFIRDNTDEVDGTYFYFYNDTLLKERKNTCMGFCSTDDGLSDTTKSLFFYNDKLQIIKEETFDYVRKDKNAKKNAKEAKEGADSFTIDLEKTGKWKKGNVVLSFYNNKGRKTEEFSPSQHTSFPEKNIWEYNEEGKLIKYVYCKGSCISYEENYKYFKNGYSYTSERRIHDCTENDGSFTTIIKLDNKGREVESKMTFSKTEEFINEKKTYYDSNGQISRKISSYCCMNEIPYQIIQVYIYKY